MKKIVQVIAISLLFNSLNSKAQPVESYHNTINGVTFTIDPRFELFNIIAMQSGHPMITTSNIPYKTDCFDYFSKFKTLNTADILYETVQKGWSIDDPMFFLLYLDNEFNLSSDLPLDIASRGGGIMQMEKLAKSMKEFAVKSDFKKFFEVEQRKFYNEIISNTSYNFEGFKGIHYLENYYGEKAKSYNLILNNLSGYGNFGKALNTPEGKVLYAIIETVSSAGNIPTYFPNISLFDLIIHEFSHGFINPYLKDYSNLISENNHLYKPISMYMQEQGYFNWQVTANEHIVRSIVNRISSSYFGEQFNEKTFLRLLRANGYIYADAIIEKLIYYEDNRKTYTTFNEFLPELLSVFDSLPKDYIEKQLMRTQSISETELTEIPKPYKFAPNEHTVFIISSAEEDKIQQNKMVEFVKDYRDMFSDKIQIITDNEALRSDLSEKDLVIFGTPNGNSFLKHMLPKIPISITDSYIFTNKKVSGTDLQLITSWVNPFNAKNSMVIYTAQKVEDIKNFYHSPNKDQYHYWVARNLVPIDVGNYQKISGLWLPRFFN